VDPLRLAADYLADPASTWSVGGYGALAEFARDPGEPCERSATQAVTARGAIRIEPRPGLAALAYEVLSVRPALWHHGVLFGLPAAAAVMPAPRGIAEIGPDRAAIRAEDRTATLFDLGLGSPAFAFCVRAMDRALIGVLRGAAGKDLFAAGPGATRALLEASPHRVAVSRAARIEVYQPIAADGGATPAGPHTHLIPRLLRPARAQSANIPAPAGWVPGLTLYPPHPAKDEAGRPKRFAPDEHAAFQRLLDAFGDAGARAAKATLIGAIDRGEAPERWRAPAGRHARQACRIALRQLRQAGAGDAAALEAWERAVERRHGA
jgi:hypothetical protein